MHLVIPFAASQSPECQALFKTLKLPHLDQLLRKLPLGNPDEGDENSLSPPHERALARAYGFSAAGGHDAPDGQLPWGAWHAVKAGLEVKPGEAWAVITPCHWAVQTNHITLTNPRDLQLQEAESRALLAAMQPYFAEDGIALHFDTPTRWLACGDVFTGLATASPYRVIGRPVDDWIPKVPAAKGLRRLQQEMQMLLYTHPLTDARADQGLLAVNSFWVSGTGALAGPGMAGAGLALAAQAPQDIGEGPVVVPNILRDAAMREDWAAWGVAWAQVDAKECAALLAAIKNGEVATLTLCGERNARTYQNQKYQQNHQTGQIYHKSSKFDLQNTFLSLGSQIMNKIRPQLSNNILSSL